MITAKELIDLFGPNMPIEAAGLLASPAPGSTITEIRRQLREIAERQPVEMLRSEESITAIIEQYFTDLGGYRITQREILYDGSFDASELAKLIVKTD